MNEIFLPVKNYEGYYSVSNLGRVLSHERTVMRKDGKPLPIKERFLVPQACESGSFQVHLFYDDVGEAVSLNRLVMVTFTGVDHIDLIIAHRDGNKKNCALDNLYWESKKTMNQRKHVNGTMPIGEKHPRHKLTSAQVESVLRHATKLGRGKVKLFSELLGVSTTTVLKLLQGKTWKHLQKSYTEV